MYDPEWIKKHLEPNQITNFDYDLFRGKNVIVGPEGVGKSTIALKKSLRGQLKVLYCTHTKLNAEEKYNQFYGEGNIRLVKSDSELFCNMISFQDSTLGSILNSNGNQSQSKYLIIDVWSISQNNKIKRLQYTVDWCEQKIISLAQNGKISASKYNYIINGELQKLFNSKGYKDYIIFYKEYDLTKINTDIFDESQLSFFVSDFDPKTTNHQLPNGIQAVRITSQAIRWLNYQKKERDKTIKESLNMQHGVIIAQNKTAELYIIDKIKDKDSWTIIIDEAGLDIFEYLTFKELRRLKEIMNVVMNHGYNTLDPDDKMLLYDLGLVNEFKNNSDIIINKSIYIQSLPKDLCSASQLRIGEIKLSKRLNSFSNTLVLTSEHTIPLLLKHYGFNPNNMEDFQIMDTELKVCVSTNETIGRIVTRNEKYKKSVSGFIDKKRKIQYSKDSYLAIGTSIYGTDYNLQSCKGRNLHLNQKLREVNWFKNPYSKSHFGKLLSIYLTLNPKADTEDLTNLIYCYVIDEMNQTLGRFCGVRHINGVKKILYLHETDHWVLDILSQLRYKGVFENFDETFKIEENFEIIRENELKTNIEIFYIIEDIDEIENSYLFIPNVSKEGYHNQLKLLE